MKDKNKIAASLDVHFGLFGPLNTYEKACNNLKEAFIEILYPDKEDRERILKDGEGYWVGNEIGGVFAWWDWYVGIDVMADYFRYDYTPDEFFEWYDQWIDKKKRVNMRSFKKQLQSN